MGENITTQDVDLLALPRGTRLRIGEAAVVEITGLRNPCVQIENHRAGLLAAVVGRDDAGIIIRKAGVMSIVLVGGEIKPGDAIDVALPAEPHRRLEVV